MSTILRFGQGAFVVAILAINSSARADSISVFPTRPTPTDSLNILVKGYTGSSPAGIVSQSVTVQGNVVRLEGCVYEVGFAVPFSYDVSYTLPPLPAGIYSIQYWVAACDPLGRVLSSYSQTAALSLTVGSGEQVPTLSDYMLVAVAAMMLGVGLVNLRARAPPVKRG